MIVNVFAFIKLYSPPKKRKKSIVTYNNRLLSTVAGLARFERADDGVKVRCLTPWLQPNIHRNTGPTKSLSRALQRPKTLHFKMGWMMGFEPTVSRATIWRFNQLSYNHHIGAPEGSCSIQLSYWRTHLERVMGIEPTRPAWKAGVLPLNYTRVQRRN